MTPTSGWLVAVRFLVLGSLIAAGTWDAQVEGPYCLIWLAPLAASLAGWGLTRRTRWRILAGVLCGAIAGAMSLLAIDTPFRADAAIVVRIGLGNLLAGGLLGSVIGFVASQTATVLARPPRLAMKTTGLLLLVAVSAVVCAGLLYCLRLPGPDRNLTLGVAIAVGIPLLVAFDSRRKRAAFALMAILFGCEPAQAEEPAAPSLIAFSVRRWEGEYRTRDIPGGVEVTPSIGSIWTIRGDGTQLRKVVELGKDTNSPLFSPDGRWLYFQSNSSGAYRIYRSGIDGSDPKAIVSPADVGPSWQSAYGLALAATGRLAFTVHDGHRGSVAIADPDGSHPRVIAPDAGYLYMAALSPDGETVVCSGPAADYRLQRIRLADGRPVVLTPDHPQSFVPRVTPDGKTVIFFRRDGDVYRVGLDGTDLRKLTTGAGHVEFRLSREDRHGSSDPPDVSPDGRRIAHVVEHAGGGRILLMDTDGSHPRMLVERSTPCGRVRFSPDGRQVAFISFDGKYPQLFVVPAEGGPARQLTHLDGAVYSLAWRP